MASDGTSSAPFVRPALKRGLKRPPGHEQGTEEPASTSTSFSPAEAKMAFNTPPSLILPFLYLGSQYNAASKKQLNELRVNRILDLKERQTGNETLHELPYLAVPMSDQGDTSISEILPDCFKFIEDAKSSTEIALVHCRGGVNRSATVVLAYLMKHGGMTLKQAWEHVRERRPSIGPVPEYMKQLREYEETLFGSITLEEQAVAVPLSLNQRIGAWRADMRKNGSLPVGLASTKTPEEESSDGPAGYKLAAQARSRTSPIVRPRDRRSSTESSDTADCDDISGSGSTESPRDSDNDSN